jgi:RNA polymerase sigma-54 factor
MAFKNSLFQSQRQSTKFSTQLQQSIGLLKLSTQELEQLIISKLDSNIMLEVENNEFFEKRIHTFNEVGSTAQSFNSLDSNQLNYIDNIAEEDQLTLDSFLLGRLEIEIKIASHFVLGTELIKYINDEGYLEISIEDLNDLLKKLNLNKEDFYFVKEKMKGIDGFGIGCENITEFFNFQIINLEVGKKEKYLLSQFFNELFLERNKITIEHYLTGQGVKPKEIKNIISLSKLIKFRPTAPLNLVRTSYIVPDAVITSTGEGWKIYINSTYNSLSINKEYSKAIKKGGYDQLLEQQREAKALILGIEIRQSTLSSVIEKVFQIQEPFLVYGDLSLKPLQIKELADLLELSESTISRIVQDKFIQTPRGTYALRFFFSSSIKNDNSGKSVTTIKLIIEKLIADENKSNPLSDEGIVSLLKDQDILIARRTVSKYRKSLNIGSTSNRKIKG